MSRYEISAVQPGFKVVVGWDNPMQTFFATVHKRRRTTPLRWVGQTPSECLDLHQLAEAVAPWASIPVQIGAALEAERDTAPAPTLLQATILTLSPFPMRGKNHEEEFHP